MCGLSQREEHIFKELELAENVKGTEIVRLVFYGHETRFY
jgi:hypothetical protein